MVCLTSNKATNSMQWMELSMIASFFTSVGAACTTGTCVPNPMYANQVDYDTYCAVSTAHALVTPGAEG